MKSWNRGPIGMAIPSFDTLGAEQAIQRLAVCASQLKYPDIDCAGR